MYEVFESAIERDIEKRCRIIARNLSPYFETYYTFKVEYTFSKSEHKVKIVDKCTKEEVKTFLLRNDKNINRVLDKEIKRFYKGVVRPRIEAEFRPDYGTRSEFPFTIKYPFQVRSYYQS